MALRLSARRPVPPGGFFVLISVSVRLERLRKLENSMASRNELGTFQFVVERIKQLRYRTLHTRWRVGHYRRTVTTVSVPLRYASTMQISAAACADDVTCRSAVDCRAEVRSAVTVRVH
jgi:hypothetical protein